MGGLGFGRGWWVQTALCLISRKIRLRSNHFVQRVYEKPTRASTGAFCPARRCERQALSPADSAWISRLDPNKNRSAATHAGFSYSLSD